MAAVLALLLSGCGQQPSEAAPPDEEYAAAYRGLCRSRELADQDVGRARDAFFGESHSALHRLADETTDEDRTLAAQLLEAKNRVERELGGENRTGAAAALDELLRVSRQALISLGVPHQPCDS